MKNRKTKSSKPTTYEELGDYWDEHSLADIWDKARDVDFEVEIESSRVYFPVAKDITETIRKLAKERGVSPDTFLNLWLQQSLPHYKNTGG